MPCHWVFCFGVKVSVSVGGPTRWHGRETESLSHSRGCGRAGFLQGLLDDRPLFVSDLTGSGSQSLPTRLSNMVDNVIKAARKTLASRSLVMQQAGLTSRYCCHVLCVTDRFP